MTHKGIRFSYHRIVARRPRQPGAGLPHHIAKRGHNREAICRSKSDFLKLRQLMLEGCSQYELRVHAYVIMGNHFHLLATPGQADSLREAIKWTTGAYTQWFNFKYQRWGTAWEGRYWASLVDSVEYFMYCISYVELNPVRAGLVDDPSRYPWSSFRLNGMGAKDSLVTPHETYHRLGATAEERQDTHRRLLQAGLDGDTEKFIHEATRTSRSIGTAGFLEWQVQTKRQTECAN